MRRIASAVAAIALIAGAAHAQGNGKGNGNDKQGGGKPAAAAVQGGGNGNGGGNAKADRENGQGNSMAASTRETRGNGNAKAQNNERGNGNAAREQRGDSAQAERGNGNGNGNKAVQRVSDNRGNGNGANRTVAGERRVIEVDRDRGPDLGFLRQGARGLVDGCPPGLAKKNPPCVPPGQARNGERRLFAFDRPDWWGLSRLDDGRYLYDDGYLMRLGPDGRIAGYVPLLGGALSLGNAWPSFYQPVRLPDYYSDFYGLGPYDSYRYADDVIYRVDPETAAITSIAGLLTGDNFAIGQPMPVGYDVYNVPYGYRDQYYDTPDALYRYSDGYIYQVDPETRLIAAAIELLT